MGKAFDVTLKNPFTGRSVKPPLRYIEYMIKKANLTLNKDRNAWNEEIIAAFNGQHPDISTAGATPHLEHRFKDWVDGCSVGALTVTVGDDILLFPTIIRYENLAPFDVVHSYKDGRWHMASPSYIKAKTKKTSVFEGVSSLPREFKEEEIDDTDRWSNISGMRENVTHETFTMRNAGLTLGLVTEDVAAKAADFHKIASEEVALFAYSEPWVKQLVDKSISTKAEPISMVKTAADKIIPDIDYGFFDAIFIKKAALNSYDVQMGRGGFSPCVQMKTDSSGVRELFKALGSGVKIAEKILGDLDENPEGITRHIGDAVLDSALGMDPNSFAMGQPLAGYGTYNVMLKSTGEPATGMIIPIFDWDGKDSLSALFFSRDVWSVQRQFHGRRAAHEIIPPTGRIEPDRKGVFVYSSKGRGFCTPPVKIKSVYLSSAGTCIKAEDLGQLRMINIIASSDAQGLIPFGPELAEFAGNYDPSALNIIIPTRMNFVPLPETLVKVASNDDILNRLHEKLASEVFSGRGTGMYASGRYEINLPKVNWMPLPAEFIKKASEDSRLTTVESRSGHMALPYAEAGFRMKVAGVACAVPMLNAMHKAPRSQVDLSVVMPEKLAQEAVVRNHLQRRRDRQASLTKKACEHIRNKLDNRMMIRLAAAVPFIEKDAREIFDEMQGCSLYKRVKLAAFEGDKQTEQSLDSLFNIGILNERTLKYFNNKMDLLDDVEDFFCKLLITVRLTAMPVEEEAIETALEAISQTREAIVSLGYGIGED